MDELIEQNPLLAPAKILLHYPLFVAFPLAAFLLSIGIFSSTFVSHQRSFRYFRLLLACPCILLFLIASYPKGLDTSWTVYIHWAGTVGCLKSLDCLVTGFWDGRDDVPKWVAIKHEKEDEVRRIQLPLPTNMPDRLAYTINNLLSVFGGSFFKDRAFDWAPKEVYANLAGGYGGFLKKRGKTILVELVALDVGIAALLSYNWDINSKHPLIDSGLPIPTQLLFVFDIGTLIYVSSFLQLNLITLFLVPVLRLNPDSWADPWRDPWKATSLADLWAYRWHWVFRRWFWRASLPIVTLFRPYVNPTTLRFIRTLVIFALSTLYHLCVPMTFEFRRGHVSFWEQGTIWFFMSQPVGLMVEGLVINPITESLPSYQRTAARRIFVWVWLFGTGRWFCDSYLKFGIFQREQPLPLSNWSYARTQASLSN